MIGEVKMGKSEFFSDLWRTSTDPNWAKEHDPSNPEAVLGLASESFGPKKHSHRESFFYEQTYLLKDSSQRIFWGSLRFQSLNVRP